MREAATVAGGTELHKLQAASWSVLRSFERIKRLAKQRARRKVSIGKIAWVLRRHAEPGVATRFSEFTKLRALLAHPEDLEAVVADIIDVLDRAPLDAWAELSDSSEKTCTEGLLSGKVLSEYGSVEGAAACTEAEACTVACTVAKEKGYTHLKGKSTAPVPEDEKDQNMVYDAKMALLSSAGGTSKVLAVRGSVGGMVEKKQGGRRRRAGRRHRAGRRRRGGRQQTCEEEASARPLAEPAGLQPAGLAEKSVASEEPYRFWLGGPLVRTWSEIPGLASAAPSGPGGFFQEFDLCKGLIEEVKKEVKKYEVAAPLQLGSCIAAAAPEWIVEFWQVHFPAWLRSRAVRGPAGLVSLL